MVITLLLLIVFNFQAQKACAYLDTTPDGFKKPKTINTEPYKYKQSQYDKVVNKATEKVAPKVFGTLFTGPAGTIINIADKWSQHQEKKELKKLEQNN